MNVLHGLSAGSGLQPKLFVPLPSFCRACSGPRPPVSLLVYTCFLLPLHTRLLCPPNFFRIFYEPCWVFVPVSDLPGKEHRAPEGVAECDSCMLPAQAAGLDLIAATAEH